MRGLVQGGDDVLDQLLRVERLLGGVGGADRLAAPALDAGVEAEQAVPGEIDRAFRAELCRVEVEGQAAAVAPAAVVEARRARMGDQVKRAVECMLQRPASDAEDEFGRTSAPTRMSASAAGTGRMPPAS